MSRTSGWRRLAAALLIGASAAFLGLTIARNWSELTRYQWEVRPARLILSVPALVLVFVWGIMVWHGVLRHFAEGRVPLPRLIRIWFLSSLTRYIPGKIWQFVSAAQLAQAAGLSGIRLLTSLVVYTGFNLLSAAVAAAITLPLAAYGFGRGAAVVVYGFAVASVLLVHPRVLNTFLDLLPRFLHRETLRWTGRWRDGLLLLLLAVVSWLLYGVAFTLLVTSLVRVPWSTVLPLAGVNALSFLAGYFVFVAPAGLGAREAVMTMLLGPYAPAGVAALVAVAARLWTVAAELLGAAIVLAVQGKKKVAGPDPADPAST
ncbi:MAG TPA: lysylphosphatidylglycerol synthase domain-containing protein [Longimicrobiales bacterium]|nr:lysylphosphatidylglycerol synthase domain-containing protein [Longimicrobiales bacterium]